MMNVHAIEEKRSAGRGLLAIADLGLGIFGATLAVVLTVAPGWAPGHARAEGASGSRGGE
jgi:hypothetical protein